MRQMRILEKLNFKIYRGSMRPDPILAGPIPNCFRRACSENNAVPSTTSVRFSFCIRRYQCKDEV